MSTLAIPTTTLTPMADPNPNVWDGGLYAAAARGLQSLARLAANDDVADLWLRVDDLEATQPSLAAELRVALEGAARP